MKKVKLLEERIKKDGKALGKTVLKVDSFINHQVDSEFMDALGKDFAEHFKDCGITKVFTIESSGIAPALMTAKYLDVPMIILKKQTSKILNGKVYQTRVTLFRLLPLTLEHPLVRIQLLPYRDGRFLPENKHNIQHLQVSFFLSGKTFQLRFQYRIILLRILL